MGICFPDRWRIEWGPAAGAWTATDLSLLREDCGDCGALGLAVLKEEAECPWGRRDFPIGSCTVRLPAFPALDDLLALYLLAAREAGGAPAIAWDHLAHYAADARQGLQVDGLPPERSLQALFLAMTQEHLLRPVPARDELVREAFRLFDHSVTRLEAGARLRADPLFDDTPAFARYQHLLASDLELYREDLGRAERYLATLPPEGSAGGAERSVPLLVLHRPMARQFKLWARRDSTAPDATGYGLLLVESSDGVHVLSADPARRMTVQWLAPRLTALEREWRKECAGEGAAWYDGTAHQGTLVAAPRDGTRIPFPTLLATLTDGLRLRPVGACKDGPRSSPGRRRLLVAGVVGAIALLTVGLLVGWHQTDAVAPGRTDPRAIASAPPTRGALEEERRGAKGAPLTPPQVAGVVAAERGGERPRYALIAGACAYEGALRLNSPCKDARAMRSLLVGSYGYRPENVLFLVDRPEPGEPTDGEPTAEQMRRQLERFRTRFGAIEDSSFLFYYSGHGGYVEGARLDFGLLQPTGFFSTLKDQTYSSRGWDMQTLVTDIKRGVAARHLMVIIDSCHSGWAGAKGEGNLDEAVRELWRERAEVVLTAGARGQKAWEDEEKPQAWDWDGYSAFTHFVLQGLTLGATGFAAADRNRDRITTDEELAGYVVREVPPSVARHRGRTRQEPQFFRLDEGLEKSGQFLFVAGAGGRE